MHYTFRIVQIASGIQKVPRNRAEDPSPSEIPVYVAEGMQDAGITGIDWVIEIATYGKVRLSAIITK